MDGFLFRAKNTSSIYIPSPIFDGTIKREPQIAHKVNLTSAFDPSISIKRGRYYRDKIIVETILTPSEYDFLTMFVRSADNLFIEFFINTEKYQYPVQIEKLPTLTEAGRFYSDKYSFTFESIYTENIYIDFEIAQGYGSSYGNFYGYG